MKPQPLDAQELIDPRQAARSARLRYVNGNEPGFRRKPWGRGFTYLDEDGDHVKDPELRQRFEDLVIPPAWADVWICQSPRGHIQATGRDEKGRKQYIYHPRWEAVRHAVKFSRLLPFAAVLPQLRAQVEADMGKHKLSQAKVTAVAVRLLEESLIRVGNEQYANMNGSYGLTTLKNKHLVLSGSRIQLTFPGKTGKQQTVDVSDRRLARQLTRCCDLSGQELFSYLDEENEVQQLTSSDVNNYLQAHTGHDFTAKEFRTWGATVLATAVLRQTDPTSDPAERQKQIVQMVKEVAEALGNTPAVCRDYYIHPAVMEAHLAGELWEITQVKAPVTGLSEEETAVLQLLQK